MNSLGIFFSQKWITEWSIFSVNRFSALRREQVVYSLITTSLMYSTGFLLYGLPLLFLGYLIPDRTSSRHLFICPKSKFHLGMSCDLIPIITHPHYIMDLGNY